ncbi:DNA-binding storekeeper protein-relatedtranscriptional regulator [Striga asiatica]|uniref:DNA-binding storekeeper protein-relatedtranscriptional regulator n=1 Tax=Striga asiatica TaxID=4170 RepID=A0A5A7QY25_STRAF|nr:DNA-binding storekeeper protein-relatedtranscriptional regulator [Striga asiatica]
MAKAREPVSSGISSGEEETHDSSSEEIGSEPEQIRKTSAPPAASRKPQSDEDSESESDKKPRKKSKSKRKDKAAAASASAARSTKKRAVEEVKGTEPTVTKKSKNSKKAREPISSGTSSGEEETDDSSSEEIGSEPEQIRKTSPPPAAASASAARSTRKRAVEEVKGTEPAVTKKSKKSKKAEPEKQLFLRIWSEADQITILNGIMQFRAQKKSDLNENFDAFFEFIKKNLQIEATRAQLRDKISRMKKKYTNNKRKEHDGKGRTFTSQHEREAYDLSEKVWGAEKENGNESGAEKENMVEKGNGSGAETVGSARRFVWMRKSLLRGLGDVPAVEDKEGQMGNKEDDGALENLEIEEMKVYLRLFELKAEKAKLFVQTMIKSRGH